MLKLKSKVVDQKRRHVRELDDSELGQDQFRIGRDDVQGFVMIHTIEVDIFLVCFFQFGGNQDFRAVVDLSVKIFLVADQGIAQVKQIESAQFASGFHEQLVCILAGAGDDQQAPPRIDQPADHQGQDGPQGDKRSHRNGTEGQDIAREGIVLEKIGNR